MRDLESQFRDAVERLYEVFARYPLRKDTEMCDCCHDPGDEAKLHSKPLRELTAKDLEKYSWSALLTWGNVTDFKHFLPRLFELLAGPVSIGWAEYPVIFAKLHYAHWREWPKDEHNSVRDYLSALWQCYVEDLERRGEVGDLLCGIAHAVDDLTPYLGIWRDSGLAGHRALASFIVEEARLVAEKRKLSDAFWRDRHDPANPFSHDRTAQMNQVIDWLLSPETRGALELTYLEHSSDPLATDIATAVSTLEYLAELREARKGH